jgi:glucokinase
VIALGIDIGATTIKACVIDPAGDILSTGQRPTASGQPDQIVRDVVALANELAVPGLGAVGVAVAAFLSPDREKVSLSPNISWRDRPLRSELEQALGRPVVLENDANAAAIGEYFVGSACSARSLVMLTLGTGVGGGVVVEGELLIGAHGVAAELGHIVVVPGGERCGCGQYGCLETVASGSAIVNAVRLARGDESLGNDQVEQILLSDDALAEGIIDTVSHAIARALMSINAVLDPEIVVLGGGVIERTGDLLVEAIARHHALLVSPRYLDTSPRFLHASLGNRAGMLGVGLLAARRAVG